MSKAISDETPCRGCGAPIRFIQMKTGGKMPVEADPFKMVRVNQYEMHVDPAGFLVDCYEPHWGNCKRAKEFKRKGEK